MRIAPLGDSALTVHVADSLGEVVRTTRQLEAARLPGVEEIVPALASVSVFLASPDAFESCLTAVRAALAHEGPRRKEKPPRLVEVPVCYDPEFALDLDLVSDHTQLSPNELIRCHSRPTYRVRCLGFTPGFPYLEGLPQALATPRRSSPRTRVPPGSVAIGGGQAGIYPLVSPGGWNIIGRTPLRLFDWRRESPALFRIGDQLRFIAISREEFSRWKS
jgi:inhibitor of KinA